jgi:DNA-directed RNA polymerase subunit RPC12/RpoP
MDVSYDRSMEDIPHLLKVASPDPGLVEWLLSDLDAEKINHLHRSRISDLDVHLHPLTDAAEEEPSEGICVGLIRFVDLLSLKALQSRFTAADPAPALLLVYRDEDEKDFKMSCPYCGQKLWVRDADVDRKGRCPQCRKSFQLPDQVSHVRKALDLGDDVPVMQVQRRDVESLVEHLRQLLQGVAKAAKPQDVVS